MCWQGHGAIQLLELKTAQKTNSVLQYYSGINRELDHRALCSAFNSNTLQQPQSLCLTLNQQPCQFAILELLKNVAEDNT